MLKALIIDDEQAGIVTLQTLLERMPNLIKFIGGTTEPLEGISMIENLKPDVVFLDISMPDMNGFDLLNNLNYRDFKLVFVTAHREYALEAIKQKAYDYILKPIDIEDLRTCIRNMQAQSPKTKKDKLNSVIGMQVKDGIVFVKQKDIVRLEASGSYTIFHLDDGTKHLVSGNLKEYSLSLDSDYFFRCHNSHIINLTKVVKYINKDGYFAKMSDGSTADISRKHKDEFVERLKEI